MNSSDEKAIVKDMRLASLEVLRKTAQDVFQEKILVSNLTRKVIMQNGDNDDDNDDVIDISPNNNDGGDCDSDIGLLKIDERDLVIGRVLGRGAFCVVRECSYSPFLPTATKGENASSISGSDKFTRKSSFRFAYFGRQSTGRRHRANGSNGTALGTSSSSAGSNNNNKDSKYHPTRRRNNTNNRTRYVIKQLSSELKRSDKINFLKGTVDLAMESRFLASLDHENIICLKGVSSNGAFSEGYFIILEKVNETLGRKVKGWMDMDRQCKGITGVFTGSKKKAQRLQSERISAACDLVAGMDFLHQRNIVFRDLVRFIFAVEMMMLSPL